MPKFIDFEPASARIDGILVRRQLQVSWVTWLTQLKQLFFNNFYYYQGLGGTNFFTLMFLFLATTIPTWRSYIPISFDWGSVTVLAHGTTSHDLLPFVDLMFSALLLGNKGYVMFRPPRLTVAKLSYQFFVDASSPLPITGILIISWAPSRDLALLQNRIKRGPWLFEGENLSNLNSWCGVQTSRRAS